MTGRPAGLRSIATGQVPGVAAIGGVQVGSPDAKLSPREEMLAASTATYRPKSDGTFELVTGSSPYVDNPRNSKVSEGYPSFNPDYFGDGRPSHRLGTGSSRELYISIDMVPLSEIRGEGVVMSGLVHLEGGYGAVGISAQFHNLSTPSADTWKATSEDGGEGAAVASVDNTRHYFEMAVNNVTIDGTTTTYVRGQIDSQTATWSEVGGATYDNPYFLNFGGIFGGLHVGEFSIIEGQMEAPDAVQSYYQAGVD